MVYAGAAAPDAPGTRTGGVPLVPANFEWPCCATCDGPMQFLAQVEHVRPEPALLSIFMCQNDPGLCEEWDAKLGGNKAFVFPAGPVRAAQVPGEGDTSLGEVSAVDVREVDGSDYWSARTKWTEAAGGPGRVVLGQLGGQPAWLQDDETPACEKCATPMTFVVQLEEGHNHRTSANFGGGCGYGFRCETCDNAAFLWQQ